MSLITHGQNQEALHDLTQYVPQFIEELSVLASEYEDEPDAILQQEKGVRLFELLYERLPTTLLIAETPLAWYVFAGGVFFTVLDILSQQADAIHEVNPTFAYAIYKVKWLLISIFVPYQLPNALEADYTDFVPMNMADYTLLCRAKQKACELFRIT